MRNGIGWAVLATIFLTSNFAAADPLPISDPGTVHRLSLGDLTFIQPNSVPESLRGSDFENDQAQEALRKAPLLWGNAAPLQSAAPMLFGAVTFERYLHPKLTYQIELSESANRESTLAVKVSILTGRLIFSPYGYLACERFVTSPSWIPTYYIKEVEVGGSFCSSVTIQEDKSREGLKPFAYYFDQLSLFEQNLYSVFEKISATKNYKLGKTIVLNSPDVPLLQKVAGFRSQTFAKDTQVALQEYIHKILNDADPRPKVLYADLHPYPNECLTDFESQEEASYQEVPASEFVKAVPTLDRWLTRHRVRVFRNYSSDLHTVIIQLSENPTRYAPISITTDGIGFGDGTDWRETLLRAFGNFPDQIRKAGLKTN